MNNAERNCVFFMPVGGGQLVKVLLHKRPNNIKSECTMLHFSGISKIYFVERQNCIQSYQLNQNNSNISCI